MVSWGAITIPVILGTLAVLQAGLNRRISTHWGLGGAVLLNAIVLAVIALVLYFTGAFSNSKINFNEFKLWFLIPGVLGLSLVAGLPLAISRWGALNTFLWLIASQIVASAFWDYLVEGQPFSWKKLIGGLIAIVGAWLAVN